MSNYAKAAVNCAVLIAFAVPFAAHAGTSIVSPVVPPPAPPAPAKPPPPQLKPTPFVPQNEVSSAYQYRTRILVGEPGCQRYAAESDAALIDDRMDDQAKAALIRKIGAEAGAAGCLGP